MEIGGKVRQDMDETNGNYILTQQRRPVIGVRAAGARGQQPFHS